MYLLESTTHPNMLQCGTCVLGMVSNKYGLGNLIFLFLPTLWAKKGSVSRTSYFPTFPLFGTFLQLFFLLLGFFPSFRHFIFLLFLHFKDFSIKDNLNLKFDYVTPNHQVMQTILSLFIKNINNLFICSIYLLISFAIIPQILCRLTFIFLYLISLGLEML